MHYATEESLKSLKLLSELFAHYQTLSTSHDEEMLKMLDLLESTRQSWSKASVEVHRLNSLNDSLKRENSNLTSELRVTRDKHRESQAQIASLVSSNQSLEDELAQYKKRFNLVKQILREHCANIAADEAMIRLKELPFLRDDQSCQSPRNSRSSNTNTDEIDYDRTGDSYVEQQFNDSMKMPLRYSKTYQRRSRCKTVAKGERATKRRSASQQPTRHVAELIAEEEEFGSSSSNNDNFMTPQPKRSRVQQFALPETVAVSRHSGRSKKSSIRRSISESNIMDAKAPHLRLQNNGFVQSTLEMRTPLGEIRTNTWTKGRPISECGHSFVVERFSLLTTCAVCCKSFSNSCYKCLKCNDCNCNVHVACRSEAPMPCVPFVKTPQKGQKRRRLADLCTNKWPKLPPSIVRCVVVLEKKYLNTVGLYRVPGSDSAVKSLMHAFQSNIPPNLNKYDPEIICGCIKRILRELQDPLIPNSSYNEFISAADANAYDKLTKAIDELPVPNRHTLAFLCQHWQNVAHNSNVNQMPIENLAKCLGPTICGSAPKFNCFASTVRMDVRQQSDAETEVLRQVNVLLQLLKMDQSYWVNILESPPVDGFGSTHRTMASTMRRPLAEMEADRSLLGPVTVTPTREALIQPLTQRTERGVIFDRLY